jgi:hypothetical protein
MMSKLEQLARLVDGIPETPDNYQTKREAARLVRDLITAETVA